MLKRIIPCLLLKGSGLVKTVKFKDPKYVGDPINAVKIFNDKEVDELLFLDITASKNKKEPQFELIKDIASEAFMPFGYGGGITSLDQIEKLFKIGVEKVVINSAFHSQPDLISKAAEIFGSQSIVVGIDVKKNFWGKYEVVVPLTESAAKLSPLETALKAQDHGAGEIILNSIDRDGTKQGYDLNIIKQIADSVQIPLVACGGAGGIMDLRNALSEGGASAASAGSMFVFHGKHNAVLITYPTRDEIENLING